MIRLYEKNNITVDEKMVGQYLQDKKTARSFANYYDLFRKYRADYQIDDILAGKAGNSVRTRAAEAGYDEKLSLLGLLLDRAGEKLRKVYYEEEIMVMQGELFRELSSGAADPGNQAAKQLSSMVHAKSMELETGKKAHSLSDDRRRILHGITGDLEAALNSVASAGNPSGREALDIVRKVFNVRRSAYKELVAEADSVLENLFVFAEEAFGEGQEMLIIVTELTKGFYSAHYISRHGCRKYYEHNKELLFYERQNVILREIEGLEL